MHEYEEDEYSEDERTTEKDIEEFEKSIKKQAEWSIANYYAGRDDRMDEKEYLNMTSGSCPPLDRR